MSPFRSRTEMVMKDRSHDDVMAEFFQADPSYAAGLLAEVVRDGDANELAILKRQLSGAFAIKNANQRSLTEL